MSPASRPRAKPKPTLHRRIRAWLLAQIQGLPAGSMMPTEVEVAKRFDASRLTAHKVLAELQRDGLLRRIKGKGTFIEPRSGIIHAEGVSSRKGRVILAYPNWFSYDIWSKIERATLQAREMRLEPVEHQLGSSDGFQALKRLIDEVGDVRGAIVIPPGAILTADEIRSLDQLGIPVAVLVPIDAATVTKHVYSICKDCFKAGHLMVAALAEQGHKRIAYIANEPSSLSSDLTYDGIKHGLYAAGLHLRDLVRSDDRVHPWEQSMATGQWLTRKVLARDKVTALIYDSVPGAIGGLSAIHEQGLRIPHDVSVVVNDDYASYEEYLCPALSGIVIDRSAMVKKALRLIANPPTDGEHTIRENVRLVARASIGPPPKG